MPGKPQSVEAWKKHIEIACGFTEGVTVIGTPHWTVKGHDKFIKGEPRFGSQGVNFCEAMTQVVSKYEPDKYENVLLAIKRTAEMYRDDYGKPCHKLFALYERLVGKKI